MKGLDAELIVKFSLNDQIGHVELFQNLSVPHEDMFD
jgi:hypothetical protein